MSVAYVDTSILAGIAFGEPGSSEFRQRLDDFERLVSSNLLEAELRASLARERLDFRPGFLVGVQWVLPRRPLTDEIETVLAAGYLRGADLWHVATALSIPGDPEEVTFLTSDRRQRAVAQALGFRV